MKKRIRRGLKEGDAGFLERASDTDSALEDSSSDDDDDGSSDSAASGSGSGDEGAEGPAGFPLATALKELLEQEGQHFEFLFELLWNFLC
jgi:hypothetical protein